MLPDETRTKAEKEAPMEPALDSPLTREILSAQWHEFTERARAAGLNPLRLLVKDYRKRGMTILAGLLDALENEPSAKKKKE